MEYLNEPFKISMEILDEWKKTDKINTYFEIVYVLEGEGDQYVNNNCHPYKSGSIFLLPASDCHTYKIKSRTRFLFLKLANGNFLKKDHVQIDYTRWCNQLNFILGNYSRKAGELIENESDKNKIAVLLEILFDEYEKKEDYRHQIMQSIVVAVMSIVARNIGRANMIIPEKAEKKIAGIMQFVHYHLISEEKISMKHLASEFNIAEGYFSEYFKRNAGETFQDFVLKSKLKIAEARALYTTQSVKEIAFELGFTDSSHLNKMMRKYNQRSISEIRNMAQTGMLV
jgi:AraC-like DNA-binding protein